MADLSRPLRRSVANRSIAGVCGGLAEDFGLDPTLVRVVCAVATLPTGIVPLTITYLVLWAIIPEREYY